MRRVRASKPRRLARWVLIFRAPCGCGPWRVQSRPRRSSCRDCGALAYVPDVLFERDHVASRLLVQVED